MLFKSLCERTFLFRGLDKLLMVEVGCAASRGLLMAMVTGKMVLEL